MRRASFWMVMRLGTLANQGSQRHPSFSGMRCIGSGNGLLAHRHVPGAAYAAKTLRRRALIVRRKLPDED